MRLSKSFMAVAIIVVIAVVATGCAANEDQGSRDADVTVLDSGLPPAPADGQDGTPASSGFIVDGGLDISDALAYDGIEVVAVRGYFVSDGTEARLCELLAESYPPQCGGVSVVVSNPEALSDIVLIEEGGTQWSEEYITVLGRIVDGELTIATNVSG
jgi:hypothetical protein